MHNYLSRIFIMLYSTNWSNFIVWWPLQLEILTNMCIEIICFPVCDVINFEINLICLIKMFYYMIKMWIFVFPGPRPFAWPLPPNLYLPALAPNLCLLALALNLYLPALALNLYLPALASNLYLPALASNLHLSVLATNFYLLALAQPWP